MKENRTIAQLLFDRRNTRKFQLDFQISEVDLDLILEAARMSPTSFGILNTKVIAIRNKEFRQTMLPWFFYQQALVESSVYLLFIVDKGQYILSETIFKTEQYIQTEEALVKYQIDLANIIGMWDDKFNKKTKFNPEQWSISQAYLAVMSVMIQAEQLGIDTAAHEGFKVDQLNEFLIKQNLINEKETVAIGLALGKVDLTKSHSRNEEKIRKTKADYQKIVN